MSFKDRVPPEPSVNLSEPAEVVVASQEAVFIYAGKLGDGTQVVRDSDGVLHALVAVRRGRQDENKPGISLA